MNFRTFFLTVFSFLFLTISTSYAQQSPDEFVISLMKDANKLSNLDQSKQEQALLVLVRRGFDIPLIGRFVLGRYWRKATDKQKSEFLSVFEAAAVRTFSPLLGDIPLDTFKIVRVDYRDVNNIIITSTIKSGNETIKILWRLRKEYNQEAYGIIDITAEGISMIVTMRSEYTSFVRRNGIDQLIVKLRKKAEENIMGINNE